MKFLFLFFYLFVKLVHADMARDQIFCSLRYFDTYKDQISQITNDKLKHCTMSCSLALHCPKSDVRLAGQIKEILDALGLGTPDRDDLVANEYGLEISEYDHVDSYESCLKECSMRLGLGS